MAPDFAAVGFNGSSVKVGWNLIVTACGRSIYQPGFIDKIVAVFGCLRITGNQENKGSEK
jgi:hypothetical protein